MIHERSWEALFIFLVFVGFTLGLSFWLGRKAKSSEGYFAAHGQIPWFVNGIAFAGDYLSAASFLGICGMIAFYGYDGFLYSIGYLAGWIVALFVVAEPMKRMGRYTFADALDAKFNSPGIKLAAGISTLAVSIFYLIPQMVGAGVLVQPLLGLDHATGVILVGTVVIVIVVTAGMVSTTWVQFLKGTLLVFFSAILTWMILQRGFKVEEGGTDGYKFKSLSVTIADLENNDGTVGDLTNTYVLPMPAGWDKTKQSYIHLTNRETKLTTVWHVVKPATADEPMTLSEAQTVTKLADGKRLINGLPLGTGPGEAVLHPTGFLKSLPEGKTETGPLSPMEFFSTLQGSEVVLWKNEKLTLPDGTETTVYYQKVTPGSQILRPGEHPTFKGIRSDKFQDKINFLSLMLALFCGTASLPHILIRYYTVKDESSARRSTIVGITSIGFFYVLTLYLGLGAMTSGALDLTNDNMSAPLLAKSMNTWLFAAISAIAFTTVLGTVSGLILASAGAVTHDLLSSAFGVKMNDDEKVRVAKMSSVVVGAIAIVLGILFKNMNVSFLVGWAFSVAASANLPSLIMILFWPRVTRQGIITAIVVGMVSSLGWILLSAEAFEKIYGLDLTKTSPIVPFSQPGIVTIPLGFLTLIAVSLMSKAKSASEK
ncbi:MAG TPA: cation acetate symporter [Planctomycetaceae bacterium]|nr:cation acetate symporter [Planctomycetaceae bacterium]HRA88422.1 cation acetate symporter [Planctomycetaceae bacterium]